jgi:hypothetical protein
MPRVNEFYDDQKGLKYDEGQCERCGGRNPVWYVDSDRYNMAVNRSETVCPSCFVAAHEVATGMTTLWELRPSAPFRWLEAAGRPTPFLRAAIAKAKGES